MAMTGTERLHHQEEITPGAEQARRGRLTAAGETPERPVLAPHVQLIGVMPGTGFTDQQWLIQRDGQFIRVTGLLYRVAEQANGQRTCAEIAERVTQATDWVVEADDVRHLLRRKLIPLGLIVGEDGSVPSSRGATRESRARSPLTLNLRVQTLSPRLINPITRVLQVFYEPPLLIPILLMAGLYHWWLYRVHGILESIKDVLYTPGGLLLALAIVTLAGMFHELGHAAALRYGGGRVRGMGIGFYLIYPVLYTDVTDGYRLGRWARVRTDLGGIYFHLIFALGLIALSIASGKESVLFAVLLINAEMLYQLLPFVRLDGYWLLADLTGVPDFFSQMGPFLRSVFPTADVNGDRLPELKPWVKATFAAYLVVTVPLLAYLFFRTVRDFPRFLLWTADAFFQQTRIFALGESQGDVLIMALSGTQMLFLVLPVVGTLYILASAGHGAVRAIWNWSKPTPLRHAVGSLSAAAILCGVILLWAPQLRGLTAKGAARVPTDPASELLEQTREATAGLQTLRADVEGVFGAEDFSGNVVLQRPNLARVEIKGGADFGEYRIFSDGQNYVVYFPADNRYVRSRPGPEGHHIQAFVAEQVEYFFQPYSIGVLPARASAHYLGRETIGSSAYEVVEVEISSPRKKITRYFISPNDNLIHQVVTITERPDGTAATTWATLKNVQLNTPVDETTFQWTPPRTPARCICRVESHSREGGELAPKMS